MNEENLVPVTVLMPVYNAEKYLREAIDSVLNQTYRDFEFLIVNDGSTDRSSEIINSYTDPRIRVLNQSNMGVSLALNNGLAAARGTLIARADSDDICKPTRLEEQLQFFRDHPDYVIAGSDADYIDEEGNYIFYFSCAGHTDEEVRRIMQTHCPFIHSCVLYQKEAVLEIGGYDDRAYMFEDYFLWLRLVQKGKVANLPKALMTIRFNPSSVTIDDRDLSAAYLDIKRKAIRTASLTDAEGDLLRAHAGRISKKKKEFSYHSMLGKKYLWDNYNPALSRNHFFQSLRLYPASMRTYVFILLSLMPESLIRKLYRTVKNTRH